MRDFSFRKDISGNLVSNMLKMFQDEAKILNAPAKQALDLVVYVIFVITVTR